ncbi:uncharacterized protein FOMMEDRAFT_161470 [Fomitiporia mediterranea MF3/22]|uniref:uncharacterized protein n=1 Tax=Fomitiporia mediterranea (strain MF3/22) TaxID=694068 RepID=UPI0004408B56|nr:uncharacterized protein FOMMEDRAFT_161470 [Fomitiporia mediterranea MF3/22]EJC98643.1 hypothetical protein FOMMEDRAFT_161470 [Fomitiporia mediterranea MF3/22]
MESHMSLPSSGNGITGGLERVLTRLLMGFRRLFSDRPDSCEKGQHELPAFDLFASTHVLALLRDNLRSGKGAVLGLEYRGSTFATGIPRRFALQVDAQNANSGSFPLEASLQLTFIEIDPFLLPEWFISEINIVVFGYVLGRNTGSPWSRAGSQAY